MLQSFAKIAAKTAPTPAVSMVNRPLKATWEVLPSPFRGTRTRTVSGVVRKSVWIATHHHKRNQNGNHQDGAGDDDKNFSIHDMSP